MEPAVISALIIAIGSLLVAVVTVRQNRQGAQATNALAERVVDRDDFKEIMDRNTADLKRAMERINSLETRLEAEVEARQDADTRAAAAERRAQEAEARARAAEERAVKLEKRVTLLEQTLEANSIPIPRSGSG